LKIHGLIARPLVSTLADLRARPAMHQFITLSCISNTLGGDLIGTTR
jgi:sulfite oxidase